MKTITEYQPMIFSQMAGHAEKRSQARRRLRTNLFMGLAYSAGALWLSIDTGFVIWHWQFWLVFTPLFVAGELATHALRSK